MELIREEKVNTFIKQLSQRMYESTNMTESEAYRFAFYVETFKDDIAQRIAELRGE